MTFEIESARPFFDAPNLPLLYQAVAAGNQPAEIDLDGRSAVLWDRSYKRYVAGEPTSDHARLLRDGVAAWLAQGAPIAVIVPLSAAWTEALPEALSEYRLVDETVEVFRHERPVDSTPPQGYEIVPIDDSVLSSVPEVREEVTHMWGSVAPFLERGFGWAARIDNQIVAWCTAEYLSADRVGLGIETLPDHRRKGLATAIAVRAAATGRERGLEVFWESNTLNRPSSLVARKVGFDLVASYAIVVALPR